MISIVYCVLELNHPLAGVIKVSSAPLLKALSVILLAAHVGGTLLESSATTEPSKLVADLLYQFGLALWTGVVLVVFVEIWPEAKRRQYQQALDAYEAAAGRQARAGSGPATDLANAGKAARCHRNDGQQLHAMPGLACRPGEAGGRHLIA